MQGNAGNDRGRGAAPTLTLALALALAQGPAVAHVGRVTAVYWPGSETAALALAELADRTHQWPGLPSWTPGTLRLVVTDRPARFDSIAGGRAPAWSGALAFPASRTIVLQLAGDPRRSLRHELAHLALHASVHRIPRWFDEGYAAMAAGEWDRLDVLRVNWALARGGVPSLAQLDAYLRGESAADAEGAYALATTAVMMLHRIGGDRGLGALIAALADSRDFDGALRASYTVTEGGFEELWQREVRSRYGWLSLITSVGLFWTLVALAVSGVWYWRRRRDRSRRAALDVGWVIPDQESDSAIEIPSSRGSRGDGASA